MPYNFPFEFRPLRDVEVRVRRLFLASTLLTFLIVVAMFVKLALATRVSEIDMAAMVLLGTGAFLLSLGLLGCLRYITFNAEPRAERAVFRDETTGLYTPRYLVDRLQDEISRASRHSTSFSILYVRILEVGLDDIYMDEESPRRLWREISLKLRATLRREDLVCRWGPDSMLLFLPHTEFLSGYMLAERLEAVLREGAKGQRRAGSDAFSVSIGCATFPYDAGEVMDLIHFAEAAAHRAQQTTNNMPLSQTRDRTRLSNAGQDAD